MGRYKIKALPKAQTNNYIETELTDKEIQEYRNKGYIIEDISTSNLNKFTKMQTGGIQKMQTAGTYKGPSYGGTNAYQQEAMRLGSGMLIANNSTDAYNYVIEKLGYDPYLGGTLTNPKVKAKAKPKVPQNNYDRNLDHPAYNIPDEGTLKNVAQQYIGGSDLNTVANQTRAKEIEILEKKEAVAQDYYANMVEEFPSFTIEEAREQVNNPGYQNNPQEVGWGDIFTPTGAAKIAMNAWGANQDRVNIGGFAWEDYYNREGLGQSRTPHTMRGMTDAEWEAEHGEQSWDEKLEDIAYNPFTAAGFWARGQEVPDHMQRDMDRGTFSYYANGQHRTDRNPLDMITDVTLLGGIHSADRILDRATNDVDGDFWTMQNGLDAVNAVFHGNMLRNATKFGKTGSYYDEAVGSSTAGKNATDPDLLNLGYNPLQKILGTTDETYNLTDEMYNLANSRGLGPQTKLLKKPAASAASTVPAKSTWSLTEPSTNTLVIKSIQKGSPFEKQLSKTGQISVNNITAHINKQGVGMQDKYILQKTLDENFPGQTKIDYNEFKEAVSGQIVPLEKTIATGDQTEILRTWGLDRLGYSSEVTRKELKALIVEHDGRIGQWNTAIKNIDEKIEIWTNEGQVGGVMHKEVLDAQKKWFVERRTDQMALKDTFIGQYNNLKTAPVQNESIVYSNFDEFGSGDNEHWDKDGALGHTRTLVSQEEPGIMHFLETQSDYYQKKLKKLKADPFNPDGLISSEKLLNNKKQSVADSKAYYEKIKSMHAEGKLDSQGQPTYQYQIDDAKQTLIAEELELKTASNNLKNPDQKRLLGKNIEERLLQENMLYAVEQGHSKMRYPTSETAAKIQGYTAQAAPYGEAKSRIIADNELYKKQIKESNELLKKGDIDLNTHNEFVSKLNKNIAYNESLLKGDTYLPEHQTILKKYENAPKMIKKTIGQEVKIVKDARGNTWYEFDIPESALSGKHEMVAVSMEDWVNKKGSGLAKKFTDKFKRKSPKSNSITTPPNPKASSYHEASAKKIIEDVTKDMPATNAESYVAGTNVYEKLGQNTNTPIYKLPEGVTQTQIDNFVSKINSKEVSTTAINAVFDSLKKLNPELKSLSGIPTEDLIGYVSGHMPVNEIKNTHEFMKQAYKQKPSSSPVETGGLIIGEWEKKQLNSLLDWFKNFNKKWKKDIKKIKKTLPPTYPPKVPLTAAQKFAMQDKAFEDAIDFGNEYFTPASKIEDFNRSVTQYEKAVKERQDILTKSFKDKVDLIKRTENRGLDYNDWDVSAEMKILDEKLGPLPQILTSILRPEVAEKINAITKGFNANSYRSHKDPQGANMLTKNNMLIDKDDTDLTNPEFFNKYPNVKDREKIFEHNETSLGANFKNKSPSVTYRSSLPKPSANHDSRIYLPESIADTGVHELGHTAQDIDEWGKITTMYSDKFKYFTANTNTEIGRRFAAAMVKPKLPTKEEIADGRKYTMETWRSSPNELHADLMKARMNVYNSWIKKGVSKENAFTGLHNPTDELIEWMIKEQNLDIFFKSTTSMKEKISLIRLLPVFTGVAVTAGAAGAVLGDDSSDGSTLRPLYQKGGTHLKKYQSTGAIQDEFLTRNKPAVALSTYVDNRNTDFKSLSDGYNYYNQKEKLDKTKEFFEGWHESPMYEKMIKKSAPDTHQYYTKGRKANAKDVGLFVENQPHPDTFNEHGFKTINGAQITGVSNDITGDLTVFPSGYNSKGLIPHEYSHTTDLPYYVGNIFNNTFTNKPIGRLIPPSDVKRIQRYTPHIKSDYGKYVAQPTETRARLNDIRKAAKEMNIYDPYTQKVTKNILEKLLKHKFENNQYVKGKGMGVADPMQQLKEVYSPEEIMNLLNNVSDVNNQQQDPQTLQQAANGGTFKNTSEFIEMELSDEEIQEYRDGGYIVEEF